MHRRMQALTMSEIEHKLNVFMDTMGTIIIYSLDYHYFVFFCIRKWKEVKYQVKCVKAIEDPYLPSHPEDPLSCQGRRTYSQLQQP